MRDKDQFLRGYFKYFTSLFSLKSGKFSTFFISCKFTISLNLPGAVIVSTPQKVALADARKGIDMFKKVNNYYLSRNSYQK